MHRYADASALRDQLKELQQEADTAAAAAAEQRGSRERQFRLGQRVLHTQLGYRGIICGRVYLLAALKLTFDQNTITASQRVYCRMLC